MGRVARHGSDIGSCGVGGMGRLAREGSDIGSGGLGGKGRLGRRGRLDRLGRLGRLGGLGPECGPRSDRGGSAVSKSCEIKKEVEENLEDRTG